MSPVAMDVATDTVEVESPPSITRTTSWASLPVEVRQMILRFVCLPISRGEYNGLSSLKVARFATVCLEWQAFFEARTFRRLVLDPGSLGDFDTIVGRHDARLGYIRKLWLRVRLSKYECPDCDEPEDRAAQHWHVRASISPALIPEYSVLINSRSNNMIFTTCIQSLLGTLRLWDPARHGAQGLALMLSASSPSDTGHRFNRCEITDSYPFHYAEDLDPARSIVDYHRANMVDPFNGYLHRDWLPPLSGGHIKRAQGTPLRLEPQNGERGRYISQSKSLPAVPMIKGLVMRRQYCRDIHIKTLSWLIGRSFVALEWFRFERTISLEAHKQFSFDQGFRLHLLPSLPKTLRQLSFTQWAISITERGFEAEEVESEIPPHAQAYLPREMAKLSQRPEQFCPPWQMDTAAFLRSIIELNESPKMVESSLKHLILCCLLSRPDRSRRDFRSLIFLAAKAALSLPQLEIIELWGTSLGGEESRTYIFRYSYEDGRASIVWRSSGETMRAQTQIIAKWSEVAQKHSHTTLAYNNVPFAETEAEIPSSHGTCIYRHLLLKDLVFDPITQIILENEPYEWSLDEESDASQQGDALNSNLATPNSWSDDLLMDSLIPDADLALLQGDLMAFDTAVSAFLQKYHW